MKKVLLVFVLLLISAGALFLTQNYLKEGGKLSLFKKTSTVTIGNYNFEVIVATSQREREIGLSETNSLPQDQGMIFLFEKPDYYSFWMKNMKFPIDILYLSNQEIVTIYKNVQPATNSAENLRIYTPTGPSDKVLEIQAGLSEKYGFKNGDKITLKNL